MSNDKDASNVKPKPKTEKLVYQNSRVCEASVSFIDDPNHKEPPMRRRWIVAISEPDRRWATLELFGTFSGDQVVELADSLLDQISAMPSRDRG